MALARICRAATGAGNLDSTAYAFTGAPGAVLGRVADASGLSIEPTSPLFPTMRHGKLMLPGLSLPQAIVHMMLQRRAVAAGIATRISLPQLPRHRHHDVLAERRQARSCAADGRPTNPPAPDHSDRRNDAVELDEGRAGGVLGRSDPWLVHTLGLIATAVGLLNGFDLPAHTLTNVFLGESDSVPRRLRRLRNLPKNLDRRS